MVVEICIIYYIKNNYMFLYVINYTYLYHHIVVLDKYTNSTLPILCLETSRPCLLVIYLLWLLENGP